VIASALFLYLLYSPIFVGGMVVASERYKRATATILEGAAVSLTSASVCPATRAYRLVPPCGPRCASTTGVCRHRGAFLSASRGTAPACSHYPRDASLSFVPSSRHGSSCPRADSRSAGHSNVCTENTFLAYSFATLRPNPAPGHTNQGRSPPKSHGVHSRGTGSLTISYSASYLLR
jgi:hypothetical protein